MSNIYEGVGPELSESFLPQVHIFSRHGVFSVEDGVRKEGSGWYPVVYGKAANVFPDRSVHLWFCGEGTEQVTEFSKDGEPTHHVLHGYGQRERDFANTALWGCLREKMPNVGDQELRKGFLHFFEFSLKTAERVVSDLPVDATLVFQDYQFLLLPGILNGTITNDDVLKALKGVIDETEMATILNRIEVVQDAFKERSHTMSSFLHTSLPKSEFWNQLPSGIGSMIVRSAMSEPIGVHSTNWHDRLLEAHVMYRDPDADDGNIFVSPIGMDADSITQFLQSPHADTIRHEIDADNLGDNIVLISGRADPKNSISDVLESIYYSCARNPKAWEGVTLVLQVPPDAKEGCAEEFEKIAKMVEKIKDFGIPAVKWYDDNNRYRSLVLAERANVFISGSLLGGFEVVTLEALFANPDSKVVCSNGIGSAHVLGDLASRYTTHQELEGVLTQVLTSEPVFGEDSISRMEQIEGLRLTLTPESWLLHVTGMAEREITAPTVERQAFLERCFGLSSFGLESNTVVIPAS